MGFLGVNGDLAGAYQYADKIRKTAANGAGFTAQLQKTGKLGTSKTDDYMEYLKQKYGADVSVRNVGKDQNSMDRIGSGTAGTGNVVIASNQSCDKNGSGHTYGNFGNYDFCDCRFRNECHNIVRCFEVKRNMPGLFKRAEAAPTDRGAAEKIIDKLRKYCMNIF